MPSVARPALVALALLVACGPKTALRVRSPDKLHVAEVREDDLGRQRVELDGVARAPWSGVAVVSWSPTSERVAYVASHAKRSWVVVGARAFGPFDGVGELAWSPDGLELAIAIARGERWTVARTDGLTLRDGPEVDGIARDSIRFGPARRDGRRLLTWVAQAPGAYRLVVDGTRASLGAAFSSVLPVELDASGEHVVSRVRAGKEWQVLVDGSLVATSDHVPQVALGDARFAYSVGRGNQTAVHLRALARPSEPAVELGPYERIGVLRGPTFSFVARKGGKDVVVGRGREQGPFEVVVPLTLVQGPKGRRVVFAATAPRGIGFWEEGTVLQDGFDEVSPPEFSADGRHIGFFARTGTEVRLHVRGEQHLAAPDPIGLTVTGERFAYVGRRGPKMVVVHDRGEQPHDVVFEGSIAFTDDAGGPFGCIAGNATERSIYVALEDGSRYALEPAAKVDFFRDLAVDPLDPDGQAKQRVVLQAWVRALWKRSSPPGPGDPFRALPRL